MAAGGSLSVGSLASEAGVDFAGALDTKTNDVVLLDANTAALGGTVQIGSGGRLASINGVSLLGAATLSASGSGQVDGDFTNGGLVNGLTGPGQFLTFTGDVDGSGNFTGNVLLSDGFSAGSSPGQVAFETLIFDSTTSTLMELGGTTAGSGYDQVLADEAVLDGSLSVVLLSAFTPSIGDVFDLFVAGELTGGFDSLSLPDFSSGAWQVSQTESRFRITAVPEPSTDILPALGLTGLAARRRRAS